MGRVSVGLCQLDRGSMVWLCDDCGHPMKTTRVTEPDEWGRYLELRECPACDAAWMWSWWGHLNRWERVYRERFPRDHELGGMGLLERLDYLESNGITRVASARYEQLHLPL